MGGAQGLPLSVDEVTAGWLSDALGVAVDRAEITGVVWGTATKVLLELTYKSGGDGHPTRLCVKGGFVPELRAIMAPGYQAEARFYRDVAPELGDGLAVCFFAAVDQDTGQGVVVLEDLAAAGARFCDARQPLTVDQTAAGLELLAGWHSRRDITAPWLDAPPHFRPMVAGLLTSEHWDACREQVADGPARDVLVDREAVLGAFQALWASEDARPRSFVHGDANLTNVYLDDRGAPRFLDWQFACRGDAFHDVALFLIGALSVEDRREHEQALLRQYLDLRGEGAGSFDEAWDAYRRHPLHGAMYALTPEAMQPAAVRNALTQRFAQAVLDFDTFALLKD
jgi:hypothetical protein